MTKQQKNKRKTSKQRPDKGQYGYIDYSKKKLLIMSLVSLVSVFIIFFTGIIIYNTNKSLFSIIAAVAALPAAKLLTGYIVLIPYKTDRSNVFSSLNNIAKLNTQYDAIIGADFIISSPSKAMSIAFAYIIDGKVLCYIAHHKTDAKETEKYLKEIFDNNECQYSQIKAYKDETKFIKAVKDISTHVGKEYSDMRLYEKLCAYSM